MKNEDLCFQRCPSLVTVMFGYTSQNLVGPSKLDYVAAAAVSGSMEGISCLWIKTILRMVFVLPHI